MGCNYSHMSKGQRGLAQVSLVVTSAKWVMVEREFSEIRVWEEGRGILQQHPDCSTSRSSYFHRTVAASGDNLHHLAPSTMV